MKIVISGYGRMGHMVEARLRARGIEPALASEAVCIDFTAPVSPWCWPQ